LRLTGVECFEIYPVVIVVDYKPRHQMQSLSRGHVLDVVPLEQAKISLPRRRVLGKESIGGIVDELVVDWMPVLKSRVPELMGSISGISSIVRIGKGMMRLLEIVSVRGDVRSVGKGIL
jgi:hypothetical protein